MAVVVESTATATNNGGSSLTITKPTGLTEGERLVFVGSVYDSADTIDTKSGWTLLTSHTNLSMEHNIQWKFASASDVAASDFTFTCSDVCTVLSGALLRVTGDATNENFGTPDNDVDTSASSTTLSFSTTSSPSEDGSLFIMAVGGANLNNGATTVGSYTASDGTISWTELYDNGIDSGTVDPVVAAAYGVQSSATALTTYGATFSTSKEDHVSTLAYLRAAADGDGSVAGTDLSLTTQDNTASGTTTASVAGKTLNVTAQANDADAVNPTVWTTTNKS